MFNIIRFNPNRIIWYDPKTIYQIKQVIAVNWEILEDANDATVQRLMPPKWMLLELRSRILNSTRVASAIASTQSNHRTVLYMQRLGTKRFVVDNDWLKWNMRQLINNTQGWKLIIHTGNEPIESQIAMFHQADIVIGPHGSATANTLFCKPGTQVIEFPGNKHRGDTTNYIAASMGLDYWITPHVWTTNLGFYRTDRWKINSIVSTLDHALHIFD